MRRLALCLALLAGPAHAAYTPPIGIPNPGFRDITAAPPSTATACPSWPTAADSNCFYVDNTHGAATDTANTNGYPDKPRLTLTATSYAAGSYIVVAGGPYTRGSSSNFTLNGSEASPVWFLGAGAADLPTSSTGLTVFQGTDAEAQFRGGWWIVQGMKFLDMKVRFGQSGTQGATNALFRYNELTGVTDTAGSVMSPGTYPSEAVGTNNLVLYKNWIHDNGADVPIAAEADLHGFKISTGGNGDTQNVWYVDNHSHDNSGDSVQIGSAQCGGCLEATWPHHVYIGRNEMHHDGENAVDIKKARDVIVSQNEAYDYPLVNIAGQIFVSHDGNVRSWFLFNTAYDANVGIDSSSQSSHYIIGNVFWGITDGVANDTTPDAAGAAINVNNDTVVAANTVVDCDRAVNIEGGAPVVVNNLFGPMLTDDGAAISFEANVNAATTNTHNFFPEAGAWGGARVQITSTRYTTLAAYTSAHPTKCSGCLEGDPAFTDAGVDDYSILTGSDAKNVGTEAGAYDTFFATYALSIEYDRVGIARPQDSGWDIGAFEFDGADPPVPPTAARVQRIIWQRRSR